MCTRRASERARCTDRERRIGRASSGSKIKTKSGQPSRKCQQTLRAKISNNLLSSLYLSVRHTKRASKRHRERARLLEWESTIELNSITFVACDKIVTYLTMNVCLCVCARDFTCEGMCAAKFACVCVCALTRSSPCCFCCIILTVIVRSLLIHSHSSGTVYSVSETDTDGSKLLKGMENINNEKPFLLICFQCILNKFIKLVKDIYNVYRIELNIY